MKVLITGACGPLGQALVRRAPPQAELRALTHAELDIADRGDVRAAVAVFRPELIINAAADTALDQTEAEPDPADAVNARAPRFLAQAALSVPGCRLLHVSTADLFDGRANRTYAPGDATKPLSAHGRTQRAGEHAVLEALRERAVVLRTGRAYAQQRNNLLSSMLRLMRERGGVRVGANPRGTPGAPDSIARTLWAIAERPGIRGIVHWSDEGDAACDGFAARASGESA